MGRKRSNEKKKYSSQEATLDTAIPKQPQHNKPNWWVGKEVNENINTLPWKQLLTQLSQNSHNTTNPADRETEKNLQNNLFQVTPTMTINLRKEKLIPTNSLIELDLLIDNHDEDFQSI